MTLDEQIAQKKKELEELEAQAAAAAGETPADDAGGETPADDAAASPATTAAEGGAAGETGDAPAGEGEGAGGGDEAAKTIADLQAGLDQANKTIADLTAKFEKLAEAPAKGGPASTAAGETFDKTDDPEDGPDKRFNKTVEDAERLRGTAQGKAAVHEAEGAIAGAIMASLGVPTQKPE